MCAVCRRVLDFDSGMYVHPMKDRPVNHPTVPIPMGILEPRLRCDFCSADQPTKVLPVATFQSGPAASRGNWCCCDICAKLIQRGLWDRLVDRVILTAPREIRRTPNVRMLYRNLYRQLQDNITGPVRDL